MTRLAAALFVLIGAGGVGRMRRSLSISEGPYRDGKKDKRFVWYDEGGNISDEVFWEDGVCVDGCVGQS
jgi:hypothetical protein